MSKKEIQDAVERARLRTAELNRQTLEIYRKEQEAIDRMRWYKPWTWLNNFKGFEIF